MKNGICHGYSFSSFLFNFVIEVVIEIALFPCENSGSDTSSDRNLSELEYTDDVM